MNGYLLPGPRGRWRQNWRKDRPFGLPALPPPWSTVKLATSSFRCLRTGPRTECGSRVPIMALQTDVSGQKGYTGRRVPTIVHMLHVNPPFAHVFYVPILYFGGASPSTRFCVARAPLVWPARPYSRLALPRGTTRRLNPRRVRAD